MADGNIKISIEVDGKQINIAADSFDDLADSAKGAEQGLKGVDAGSKKSTKSIKDMAVSMGLVKMASAAFNVLKSSLDAAINRFDTLNKFPKVLQALGVSAEDSERSISRLSEGIDGLPTTLNDIAGSAQSLYMSFNDIDQATETAIGLNNAFLASGASAADAKRGTDQYIQMLNAGKPDMQSWKSLQDTMPLALQKTAEAMGFTGRTAKTDLYNALKDGSVTFDQFNAKITELGTGTGELAELARENSQGISTSFSNLRNSVVKGLANILNSFNKLSIALTGKDIAQNIDSLKAVVNASFKAIGKAIEVAIPLAIAFKNGIQATIPVVSALTPVILGLIAAYSAFTIITKAKSAIETANAVIDAARTSTKGLTIATGAQTLADVKAAATKEVLNAAKKKEEILTNAEVAAKAKELIATNVQTVATAAQTGAVSLSTLAIGVMTGQIGLLTAAKIIATTVTYALKAALDALSGPIGWVVGGIGLLVTGGIALVKWLKKETEESKRLTSETEKLAEATDELADTVSDSTEAYEDSQKETAAQSKANKSLAEEITKLTEKENKSAAEKMMLKDKIEQLNGSVDGLNLSYSEEADALNMSNEQLQGKVDLMAEQASYNEALQRQVEIEKEQHEVAMQLEETNALREEWNQKLEDGSVKAGKHKEEVAKLDEQEALLTETNALLGEQYTETETQITESAERIATATSELAGSMIIDFENLEGAQKEAFDSMEAAYTSLHDVATDAFDKIETKTDHTMESMIETMEHNQEQVEKWGENQAKLMDWAGKNGYDNFIPYIENMGIDSAAELAVMANASEEELVKFADTLDKGGSTAGSSLKTSLGGEYDEIVDKTVDFIDSTSSTMKSQIDRANFEEIGEAIPGGLVLGVVAGASDVSDATGKMMEDSTDAAKEAIDSHSPSKVYMGMGGDMTDGLALGINEGTTTVISATKSVLASSIGEFKNVNSSYYDIGADAMTGLNAGLDAGRESVMATARGIANEVAKTMKKALDIHSPSRVMERDVGRWIPEGLIKGVERTAPKLYKALGGMATTMTQVSTPEMALGTHKMAYAGGISNNSNFTTKTDKSRKMENKITINTNDSGAKEMERTLRRLQFGF